MGKGLQEFLERARNKIQRARTGLRERWRFTGKLREGGGGGEEEYKIKGRTTHPSNKDLPNNKKKKERKKEEGKRIGRGWALDGSRFSQLFSIN